jgi:hypothetical protein
VFVSPLVVLRKRTQEGASRSLPGTPSVPASSQGTLQGEESSAALLLPPNLQQASLTGVLNNRVWAMWFVDWFTGLVVQSRLQDCSTEGEGGEILYSL